MKIGICNDHAGVDYKFKLVKMLQNKGIEVVNFGTDTTDSVDYPDFAHKLAAAVENGAGIITLCDSAAEIMPDDFGGFIKEISDILPENVTLGVCTNNKNGLAAANSVIAIRNGAKIIKTDVGI